jgi:hypothetical protein
MKKTLLLATALLLTTACTNNNLTPDSATAKTTESQELKGLNTALNAYTKATVNNDVEKLMDFVYPKVFTVVPREKMSEVLTKAYASGKVPTIKNVKHVDIQPAQKYEGGVFTIVTSTMTTELKSPRPDNPKFEAYMLEMLEKQIASQGGTVNFDKDKHLYSINHSDKTVAIKENDGWKFAGINQAKKYAEKGILPKEIVSKLN